MNDDVDDGPSPPEVLLRSEGPTPLYCDHLHEEVKAGYSCRQLPSEGNRGSYMPARPSS